MTALFGGGRKCTLVRPCVSSNVLDCPDSAGDIGGAPAGLFGYPYTCAYGPELGVGVAGIEGGKGEDGAMIPSASLFLRRMRGKRSTIDLNRDEREVVTGS